MDQHLGLSEWHSEHTFLIDNNETFLVSVTNRFLELDDFLDTSVNELTFGLN